MGKIMRKEEITGTICRFAAVVITPASFAVGSGEASNSTENWFSIELATQNHTLPRRVAATRRIVYFSICVICGSAFSSEVTLYPSSGSGCKKFPDP